MSAEINKLRTIRNRLSIFTVAALLVATLVALAGADAEKPAAINHYVGSDTCKNCHSQKEKGDQYHVWKKMKHATAFETLATEKAKEQAKKVGVDNPQTDPKCITCHETGYGLPKENFAKTFVEHQGVQCESCHGPGEKHKAARMDAAGKDAPAADAGFGDEGDAPAATAIAKIPEGEILMPKDEATCVKCHNDKSPNFPGKFDFADMSKKIEHKDPRKQAAAPK
ncbi:MAG TPA: cytochrome c family protein [Planctomycetota bacterium]|jgi:hypothetical protein|nr:cytochrome c family protein [Planctomycetota bacterium]